MTDTAQTIGDIGAIPGGPALTDLIEVERPGTTPTGGNATLAQLLALASGGGIGWAVKSAASALAPNAGVIVTAAVDVTLPANLVVGEQYIIHAKVTGVRVVSNGNVITGVGAGNNLTLAAGETAHLIASAIHALEIV